MWKAAVIPVPSSLTGGTDFPRLGGLGELRILSEISPQTLQIYQVSSVQAKVARKGPWLCSKFSALLIGEVFIVGQDLEPRQLKLQGLNCLFPTHR